MGAVETSLFGTKATLEETGECFRNPVSCDPSIASTGQNSGNVSVVSVPLLQDDARSGLDS